MTRWYVENIDPSKMLGDLGAMFGQNTTKLRAAPPYLQELLMFPYQQGQQFAMALYESGGTAAIDAAFRNPPTMHEGHSSSRELSCNIAPHPSTSEPPRLESKDWRLIGSNVLGEFGMGFLLKQGMGAYDAQVAGARLERRPLHVYEQGTNGPTALVWATAWEDEQQAGEFGMRTRKWRKRGRSVRGSLHIHRDGKHVTIVQSSEPSFLDLWESGHAAHKSN